MKSAKQRVMNRSCRKRQVKLDSNNIFRAANSYRLNVPTVYVQIRFPFTNSFSRIIFINSLSPIFFYKFNITNSFSRINLRIRKSSKKFVRIRKTSFWFVFAKSVLCCERPVL